jgi:hypothetical protein
MPKRTAVAFSKFVPVIVTVVPPDVGPAVGLTPVTVGAATYVNRSADEVADVPPAVVTVTSTVPAVPEGLRSTICVAVSLVKLLTMVVPKRTAVALPKFVPVIVTDVPPDVGPAVGLRPDTVGAATYVN